MAVQVNEVQPGQVVVTDAPTNTKQNVEFGTCIWTTGIKMHPLVGKLAKTLPQGIWLPSATIVCSQCCMSFISDMQPLQHCFASSLGSMRNNWLSHCYKSTTQCIHDCCCILTWPCTTAATCSKCNTHRCVGDHAHCLPEQAVLSLALRQLL